MKKKGREYNITEEMLRCNFFIEALSINQVARKYACSYLTIKYHLEVYGIYLDPEIWYTGGTSSHVRKLLLQGDKFTPRQVSILVGLVLGDGHINKGRRNSQLQFEQAIRRKGYVQWIRDELQPFTPHPVHKTTTRGWGGKLFDVDVGAQDDLNSCTISEDLQRQFKNGNIPLSVNATATVKEVGAKWLVTDGDKKYLVERRKDKLSVHSRVTYFGAYMGTVKHPELTKFYTLFYPNGKKTVPEDIVDYIDDLALKVWYEGDGHTNCDGGSNIATQSFTVSECKLLLEVLRGKFDLEGHM